MMSTRSRNKKRDSAHPRRIDKTSEFIGIVIALLSICLQQIYPIKSRRHGRVQQGMGLMLMAVSVVILRKVHQEFARYKQPHDPGKPTTVLIAPTTTTTRTTTGRRAGASPFWYSRNPTYAAIVFLTQPGLALLLNNGWMAVTIPLSMIMFWCIMIQEEEMYLRDKFGTQWDAYCQQTRRWI